MKLGLCAEDAVTHNLAVVWSWRDLESGWVLRRTNAAPIGVRKDNV